MDYESETFIPINGGSFDVAHALRGNGFDASEDGTGRGTPLVPVAGTLGSGGRTAGSATNQDAYAGLLIPVGVALRGRDEGGTAELTGEVMTSLRTGGGGGDKPHVLVPFDETQITSSENRSQPKSGDPSHPLAAGARPPTIAFTVKDYGGDAMEGLSQSCRSAASATSHANAGVMPAIAFRTTGNDGVYETGDIAASLSTATDPNQITLLQSWRVRRLTPRECERLMGFEEGYTDVPYRKRNWTPDGPRYRSIGNSMAVNCMRWLGWRIKQVDAMP